MLRAAHTNQGPCYPEEMERLPLDAVAAGADRVVGRDSLKSEADGLARRTRTAVTSLDAGRFIRGGSIFSRQQQCIVPFPSAAPRPLTVEGGSKTMDHPESRFAPPTFPGVSLFNSPIKGLRLPGLHLLPDIQAPISTMPPIYAAHKETRSFFQESGSAALRRTLFSQRIGSHEASFSSECSDDDNGSRPTTAGVLLINRSRPTTARVPPVFVDMSSCPFSKSSWDSSEFEDTAHTVHTRTSTASLDLGSRLNSSSRMSVASLDQGRRLNSSMRTSTASLDQGRRLNSSRRHCRPLGADSDRRLTSVITSTWSQGDENVNWRLNLKNKNLKTIPDYVFQRANLRDLQLTGNSIREVPHDILRLEYLHALKLDSNNLAALPAALGNLYCLKILNVSHNYISEFQAQLTLPGNLIAANFSHNKLKYLPENLFMSSSFLQILDLSMNELVEISSCEWDKILIKLESFDLKGNKIQNIPATLLKMPCLCRLDISENHLVKIELPASHLDVDQDTVAFTLSPMLKSIECKDNPYLYFPPPEILLHGGGVKVVEYIQQTLLFRKVKNIKENIARLEKGNIERLEKARLEPEERRTAEITEGNTAMRNPNTERDTNEGDGEAARTNSEIAIATINLKKLRKELQSIGMDGADEDLAPNTSLSLMATGTNQDGLHILLNLIGAECTSEAGEILPKHCHGRWMLESADNETENMPIRLKILRMHGSVLLDQQQKQKQAKSSAGKNLEKSDRGMFHFRRAVFLVAWRIFTSDDDSARADEEIAETTQMINAIMKSSPSSRIFVVPTVASAADLKSRKVQAFGARIKKAVGEYGESVHLCAGAVCIQDSYEQKGGMRELKTALRACVMSSPFFNELLPTYILKLREKIAAQNKKPFLSWDEYKRYAKSSDVPAGEESMQLATAFLHEMGELRYFGRPTNDRGSRCMDLLSDSVFINMAWLMDVVDLLMDVDTTRMISYFAERDPSLALLASTFVSEGILHPRLAPFIWPSLSNREKWPGVDSKLILCYWTQEQETTQECSRTMIIGTDTASLERAFAACVGLHLAFDDTSTVSLKAESPLVEPSFRHKVLLVLYSDLTTLRDFNKKLGPYFQDEGNGGQLQLLQPVIVPNLAFKAKWHEPRQITVGRYPMCCQKFRVHLDTNTHLPSDSCRERPWKSFIDTEQTLAVYETVKVSRISASANSFPNKIQQATRSKPGVYSHQQENVVDGVYTIGMHTLHTHLRRTLRVSLQRRESDPIHYVGCAAMLSLPTSSKEKESQWDLIQDFPVDSFVGDLVHVEHSIVLYRVSPYPQAPKKDKFGCISEVASTKMFVELIRQRNDYDRHLCYMIFSEEKGVNFLKSLVLGHNPTDCLIEIRNRFGTLIDPTIDSPPAINKIPKSIKNLNGFLIGLDVSNNPSLKGIPAKELCHIESLTCIECLGSPQVYGIPAEVAKLGGTKVLEYLRSVHEKGTECKDLQIIVIGNGEAGKTSLIQCITNEARLPGGMGSKHCGGVPCSRAEHDPGQGGNVKAFCNKSHVHWDPELEPNQADTDAAVAAGDKSGAIGVDARTVGIEMTEWEPTSFEVDGRHVDPDGLKCRFLDLGGQAVYASSNQFFLVPRALYIMAWRVVRPSKHNSDADEMAKRVELESMIIDWMDMLQVRIPGASVVLVATHVDCVEEGGILTEDASKEVTKQCNFVKQIVQRKLNEIRLEAAQAGVAALEVYQGGQSMTLSCLEGKGVPQLRRALIELAHKLPFWKESIPASYHSLRKKIDELRVKKGKNTITWKEYEELASKECGMKSSDISIATSFLSDMAVIKYFGQLNEKGTPDDEDDVLDTTIFISPNWIIDGLKGLIRHDRQVLMEYIQSENFKENCPDHQLMLRHLNRLATCGVVDQELIPFIWPNGKGWKVNEKERSFGDHYWKWLDKENRTEELRLWPKLPSTFSKDGDDYKRAIALLKGCDFVFEHVDKKGHIDYIAPVLLVQDGKIDPRSFSVTDCPIKHEYNITGIALGFFDRLLVRVRKAGYAHVEYSKDVGICYGRGVKAQMIFSKDVDGSHDGTSSAVANGASSLQFLASFDRVPRSRRKNINVDNIKGAIRTGYNSSNSGCGGNSGENVKTVPSASCLLLDPDAMLQSDSKLLSAKLIVSTSTRKQQISISKELKDLHQFFPGMSIWPYPDPTLLNADKDAASKEPIQVRIVSLDCDIACKIKKLLTGGLDKESRSVGALPLRIDAGKYDADRDPWGGNKDCAENYMDFDSRVVLMCMTALDIFKQEVKRAIDTRIELEQYEKDYNCMGAILDEQISSFVKNERQTPKVESRKKKGLRVSDFGLPESRVLEDEAFQHIRNKDPDYKQAIQKLQQALWSRQRESKKELRPFLAWRKDHEDLIEEILKETKQCTRILETGGDNVTGKKIVAQELDVLHQLKSAAKILRTCNKLVDDLCSESRAGRVTSPYAEPERLKDLVARIAYFEIKYQLLWTRLDLLHIRRRIATHKPELNRIINSLQSQKYGISDMRRATDAFKGNRQEVDKLIDDEDFRMRQLKKIESLETKISRLDIELAHEIEWMIFVDEFEWHVRKGRQIIALICPGYFAQLKERNGVINFSQWWPDEMPLMSKYALFVDLTNHENLGKEVHIKEVIFPRADETSPESKTLRNFAKLVEEYLDNWRGPQPDPQVFKQPDLLPCHMCVENQEIDPFQFDRKTCEHILSTWQEQQLDNYDLNGSTDISLSFDELERQADLLVECKRNPNHKLHVQELLSKSVIFDAVPCPQCMHSTDLPPTTWDRKTLMDFFSVPSSLETMAICAETDVKKEGHVGCDKCERAGRPKNLAVIDVIKPQVFFSYNWGSKITLPDGREFPWGTQAFVIPLRNRVELSTELLIWLDVGGGMNLGQSHINLMEEGIKKATVVVIFLSDAYVNSPNCQREFLHSVRNHKYIVPVLLPPEERLPDDPRSDVKNIGCYVPNSGWTGHYDANAHNKFWFQHIYSVIKKNSDGYGGIPTLRYDPDYPTKLIDWGQIGRFEPIDMREVLKSQKIDSKEEKKLIEKIMSRFHRGNYIDHGNIRKYNTWKQKKDEMKNLLATFKHENAETLSEKKVEELFGKIDSDKSGSVSAEEVMLFFTRQGFQFTIDTAKQLIKEADQDGTGQIELVEFKGIVTELLLAREEEEDAKRLRVN